MPSSGCRRACWRWVTDFCFPLVALGVRSPALRTAPCEGAAGTSVQETPCPRTSMAPTAAAPRERPLLGATSTHGLGFRTNDRYGHGERRRLTRDEPEATARAQRVLPPSCSLLAAGSAASSLAPADSDPRRPASALSRLRSSWWSRLWVTYSWALASGRGRPWGWFPADHTQ